MNILKKIHDNIIYATVKNFNLLEENNEYKLLWETNFPSNFGIGDLIYVKINDTTLIPGHIRCVIFSNMKVRYTVQIYLDNNQDKLSSLHNIDSVLIVPRQGKKIEIELDNYS